MIDNAGGLQDLHRLVDVLRLTHELLAEHVRMDPFPLMLGEMTETISLVSFSGRVATQVSLQTKCLKTNITDSKFKLLSWFS